MTESADAEGQKRERPGSGPSLVHLLLVWVLVGFSLMGLGVDLVAAMALELPVSAFDGGLLFGTVVVVALWIAGFRPSVPASLAYFVVQLIGHLCLVVAVESLVSAGAPTEPLRDVAVRGTSIVLAAGLSFTDVGRRGRVWVRRRGRALLKLPPAEQPDESRH